jgi:hypothetical protein
METWLIGLIFVGVLAAVVVLFWRLRPIREGKIISKEHEEAFTWQMPACTSETDKGIPLMVPTEEPESWWFKLEGQNGRMGWIQVEYSVWQRAKIGDRYPQC